MRVYTITRGRGGAMTTGIFCRKWDEVEELVLKFSQVRYHQMKTEEEGVGYINIYFK